MRGGYTESRGRRRAECMEARAGRRRLHRVKGSIGEEAT